MNGNILYCTLNVQHFRSDFLRYFHIANTFTVYSYVRGYTE